MTYKLIKENFEFNKKTPVKDFFEKVFEGEFQNGIFDVVGIFDNLDEAYAALQKCKNTYRKVEWSVPTWFWSADLYYLEEFDEEGEPTGNFWHDTLTEE